MATNESPLVSALPPVTDYISYLTIVEQYLTRETLPILLQVLQDETLTTNIGWDLIHVLVPFLPDSKDCLQTIARLGNPREVILKVTEALRLLEPEDDESGHADDDHADHDHSDINDESRDATTASTDEEPLSLAVEQFTTLLSMLVVLHARIKTNYPSRFLSTTLQAILASFSQLHKHREELVFSIVQTIKKLRGVRRPALPSRSSSGMLSVKATPSEAPQPAQDPEAPASTDTTSEESALQIKLFQSFATHVVEEYLGNLTPASGLSHMAWSSRVMEHLHPERTIPHTKTMSSRFVEDPILSHRVDTIGQLASLSQDLSITEHALLSAVITSSGEDDADVGEEDPPSSAADVPLSSAGSAMLFATSQVSATLYGNSAKASTTFSVFPDHRNIIKAFLSDEAGGLVGSEPETLVDACVVLGLLALENDRIGAPDNDEDFKSYLRTLALLASNCPDPTLRGHAHYLASTVLRSNPDVAVQYDFIRDTLQHSVHENLKPVAVVWLKGAILESTMTEKGADGPAYSSDTPLPKTQLDSLATLVFPALAADLVEAPLESAWTTYQVRQSFYLASLNFLYLLVHSDHLRRALDIQQLWTKHDIAARFVDVLGKARARFSQAVEADDKSIVEGLDPQAKNELIAELNVLAQALDRVGEASIKLS